METSLDERRPCERGPTRDARRNKQRIGGPSARVGRSTLVRRALLSTAALLSVALTAPAGAAVRIDSIYFDPPGSDTGGNINQEYVVIENTGNRVVQLRGWTLRDIVPHVFRFPRFRLRPDRSVRIHTGNGQNDGNDLYWRSGSYIWNNHGDKAILKRPTGRRVDTCRYADSAASPFRC